MYYADVSKWCESHTDWSIPLSAHKCRDIFTTHECCVMFWILVKLPSIDSLVSLLCVRYGLHMASYYTFNEHCLKISTDTEFVGIYSIPSKHTWTEHVASPTFNVHIIW